MSRTVNRLCTLLDRFGDRDAGRFPSYAAFPSERRPDWSHWFDRSAWDVVHEAVPLLLDDEPSEGHPYLSSRWWEAHHEKHLSDARTILVVLDAAETGKLEVKRIDRNDHDSRGRRRSVLVGWTVEPLVFVDWASKQTSIRLPEGMLSAALDKGRRLHPAVPRVDERLAAPGPSSDDDDPIAATPAAATSAVVIDRQPPRLPPRTPRRKREALATAIAMRFAGIEVKGKAGARAIGFEDDETIAGYLADSQPWGKVWKAQREWADGPGGDWGAVFKALRQWVHKTDD